MRLAKWTDENRLHFNQLRVRGRKLAEALRATLVEFPDAEQYQYQTVLAYVNSTQGSSDLKIARDGVTASAKESFLATSGGRLDMMAEVAADLMAHFSHMDNMSLKIKLAGEIRSMMREIRLEVDPLGLDNTQGTSHFEKMLTSFNVLAEKDKETILAVSEATWAGPHRLDEN